MTHRPAADCPRTRARAAAAVSEFKPSAAVPRLAADQTLRPYRGFRGGIYGQPASAVHCVPRPSRPLSRGPLAPRRKRCAPIWSGVRLRALIDHPAGPPEAAAASFATCTAGIDPASASLADALFALDYGRFLIESRQRKTAVAPLLIARTALARLGASHLRQECDAALAACGVSESTAHDRLRDTPLKSLTAREQVVARMVAHGLTNREVAADLYLSVKAVEYHLANIFGKLGISSRRHLHAALAGHPSADA